MTAITAGSFLKALHAETLHVGNRRLQYHRAENRFGGQQSGAALDRKLNKRKRRAEDHNEGNRLATTLLMMSGTLYEGQYRHAGREGECPHTQIAVIVDGGKAGTVLHVCAEEKCKIHRQVSHYQISPKEKEQRRKLALAIRVQKESRSRILQAVRQKLPPEVARTDFEMVALDYFRRLGHDNHHRLFQIYGWEEKKTKTSWVAVR